MLQRRYCLAIILLVISLAACSATPSPMPSATPASATNAQPTLAPTADATRDPNAPLPFDDVSASSDQDQGTQGTFTIAVGASRVVLPNIGGEWADGDFITTNTALGLVLRVDIVRGLGSDQTALSYAQAAYPTGDAAQLIAGTDFFVKRDEVAQTTQVGRKTDATAALVLTFAPLRDAAVLETQFDVFVQMLREAEVR